MRFASYVTDPGVPCRAVPWRGECDDIPVERLPADVAEPIRRALEQRLADRGTEDGAA